MGQRRLPLQPEDGSCVAIDRRARLWTLPRDDTRAVEPTRHAEPRQRVECIPRAQAAQIRDRIRANRALKIDYYFFTDDNFSRNPEWEPIFDALIALRKDEGVQVGRSCASASAVSGRATTKGAAGLIDGGTPYCRIAA